MIYEYEENFQLLMNKIIEEEIEDILKEWAINPLV